MKDYHSCSFKKIFLKPIQDGPPFYKLKDTIIEIKIESKVFITI